MKEMPAAAEETVEVWKSTVLGRTWIKRMDNLGRETDFGVRGKQTFTVTTFDRQTNQMRAALSSSDPFRNGRFVLVKPSPTTNMDEISSPDAWTDGEIDDFVLQLKGTDDPDFLSKGIREVTSPSTLGRIKDAMLLEDVSRTLVTQIEAKLRDLNPNRPVVVDRTASEVYVRDGRNT